MTDEHPTAPDEPQDARAHADDDADESPGLLRSLDFDTPQPLSLDIGDSHGPVTVELTDTAVTHVEVRHAPDANSPDWRGGLAGLLNWVTEQFGEAGVRTGRDADRGREREPATEAVRRTRVELTGNRLVVRTPNTAPLRNIPLAGRVQAPAHSELSVQAGSGDVTVTGTAVRAQVQSGGGAVSVAESTERATVRTGSGQLHLGRMAGGVHARSGSGDVEITGLFDASSVVTGSADVWLGEVGADVLVRSGSGDLSITDAASGEVELITGSGEIQVGLRRGRSAEVDLTSSAGSARSDLDVRDTPLEENPNLHVYGRTGTGDAVLTSAL